MNFTLWILAGFIVLVGLWLWLTRGSQRRDETDSEFDQRQW